MSRNGAGKSDNQIIHDANFDSKPDFMRAHGLKDYEPEDFQEAKAILNAYRESDACEEREGDAGEDEMYGGDWALQNGEGGGEEALGDGSVGGEQGGGEDEGGYGEGAEEDFGAEDLGGDDAGEGCEDYGYGENEDEEQGEDVEQDDDDDDDDDDEGNY
jgi:hypothetical protein